jgi:hypothetical protein
LLHSITGSINSPLHVNENQYSSAKNTVIVDQLFHRKQAEETDESYVLLRPNRVTQKQSERSLHGHSCNSFVGFGPDVFQTFVY